MEALLSLLAKLAMIAVEAEQSATATKEEIDAKFKAALLEAATKAGFDFTPSDNDVFRHLGKG